MTTPMGPHVGTAIVAQQLAKQSNGDVVDREDLRNALSEVIVGKSLRTDAQSRNDKLRGVKRGKSRGSMASIVLKNSLAFMERHGMARRLDATKVIVLDVSAIRRFLDDESFPRNS